MRHAKNKINVFAGTERGNILKILPQLDVERNVISVISFPLLSYCRPAAPSLLDTF